MTNYIAVATGDVCTQFQLLGDSDQMLSPFLPGAMCNHLPLTQQASHELFLEVRIKTAILVSGRAKQCFSRAE